MICRTGSTRARGNDAIMIISHRHKFIFVRVPKTGSTSIQIELSKLCGPTDVISPLRFRNDPAGEQAGFAGAQNHDELIAAERRRDWLRLLLLRRQPRNLRHATAAQIRRLVGREVWDEYYKFCVVRNPFDRAISLYAWRFKNKSQKPSLDDFILEFPADKLGTWHRYTIGDKPVMSAVCRFETLQADFDAVLKALDLPLMALPRAKVSRDRDSRHYSQLIGAKARARLEQISAAEIEAFQYAWADG